MPTKRITATENFVGFCFFVVKFRRLLIFPTKIKFWFSSSDLLYRRKKHGVENALRFFRRANCLHDEINITNLKNKTIIFSPKK